MGGEGQYGEGRGELEDGVLPGLFGELTSVVWLGVRNDGIE
jgi:hypothetical protein